jgi:hypothetical protein
MGGFGSIDGQYLKILVRILIASQFGFGYWRQPHFERQKFVGMARKDRCLPVQL